MSIEEIAKERNLVRSTIAGHLAEAYFRGENINIDQFVSKEKQKIITQQFKKIGVEKLTPIKQALGADYSYEEIRFVKATIQKEGM